MRRKTMRRLLPPRPHMSRAAHTKRGRRGRRGQFLLSAILGVGLALLVIYAVDTGVRPVVEDIAQTKVHNTVTQIVNGAVMDTIATQAVAYDDIIRLQKDDTGRITAMSTSTAQMNALRSEILGTIVGQVDTLDAEELGIPLGNLTGFASASDRGPVLPVRVVSVASAQAQFENAFLAAGINQTLHRVMLNVTVDIRVLIPGGSMRSEVVAQVPVAETILVGEVPDAYLQFGIGSGGSAFDGNTGLSDTDVSTSGRGDPGLFGDFAPAPPGFESLGTV